MSISALISLVYHRRSKCTGADRQQTLVGRAFAWGEAMINPLHVRSPGLLLRLGDPASHSVLRVHAGSATCGGGEAVKTRR